jgi:hypothetical protein
MVTSGSMTFVLRRPQGAMARCIALVSGDRAGAGVVTVSSSYGFSVARSITSVLMPSAASSSAAANVSFHHCAPADERDVATLVRDERHIQRKPFAAVLHPRP